MQCLSQWNFEEASLCSNEHMAVMRPILSLLYCQLQGREGEGKEGEILGLSSVVQES